ncbi:uncharacterized protein LOC120334116 [Styela clava]
MHFSCVCALSVLIYVFGVNCATVNLPDGRSGEITATSNGNQNTQSGDGKPKVVARSGLFTYHGLSSFINQLSRNGNGRDKEDRAPPTEYCEPMSVFPEEQKCRKGSVKDKDKDCDVKECIMNPTVGYTVPSSYFELFNIPQYYRYMFSKQIVNPNPFGGFGQQGQFGGMLQMLLSQMGGGQYGYPGQTGYPSMGRQYGYTSMGSQTGYPITNTQTGYPATNTHTGYPVTNTQSGYPVTNTQSGYPVTDTQSSYPYTNTQTGYTTNSAQTGHYPSYGSQYQQGTSRQYYNPYNQNSYSQYPQTNYQQYQSNGYNYPQSTGVWGPQTRSSEITEEDKNADKNDDKKPKIRSFGFDTYSMMNNYGYNPMMQYQQNYPMQGPIIATMCKRPGQACQCKTSEDCECKSRRPKLCTQKYTDERRLFRVWEYVTIPVTQTHTYTDQTQQANDGQTYEQDPATMRSGDGNDQTFPAQSQTHSTTDYQQQQQPQQQQPQGRYELQQKWLYFRRPSGCECETMKKTQEYNFFG